jgi:nitrous oxidase accessory protein
MKKSLCPTWATLDHLESRRLLATLTVNDVAGLVNAVDNGAAGDVVRVEPGTYVLANPLKPKANMTIEGTAAGVVFEPAAGRAGDLTVTPDSETNLNTTDTDAYLIDLGTNNGSGSHINGVDGVTIDNLTLDGDGRLYGGVIGVNADNLTVTNSTLQDFTWAGIRSRSGDGHVYSGNDFIDASGRVNGRTGGMVWGTYLKTSVIEDNTFTRTPGSSDAYGIKGREFRSTAIRYNTMDVGRAFSVELPFENDNYVDIHNNYLSGPISIPKTGGGGPVPSGGYTFRIYENYFRNSYSIEGTRNGVEVYRNLFDFETGVDGGNLVSQFGGSVTIASGPFTMHNNLIKNPGRGIFWSDPPQNNLTFRNNEVIGNTTVTPRTEGLFGIKTSNSSGATDWSTIEITDNVITLNGQTRNLMRSTASRASVIENNTLINVGDTGGYANPDTGAPRGLEAPLLFDVGDSGEYTVDGWNLIDNGATPTLTVDLDGTATDVSGFAAYGSQDGAGGDSTAFGIENNGSDIRLTGNAWKVADLAYTVTSDTVLEFTVDASDVGEILAISLDSDDNPTNNRRGFRFGGVDVGGGHDAWSWQVSPTYSQGSGTATYSIPVGDYFTGSVTKLGLVADDDAGSGSSNVVFGDISLTEVPPPPPSGNTLLADDFNDGNLNGWTATGGTWKHTNGQAEQEDNTPNTSLVWNDSAAASWTDYRFDADVRSTDDDIVGLMFRVQPNGDHYRFVLSKQSNFHKLEVVTGGTATTLASVAAGYTKNQVYAMSVEVDGDTIRASLDGVDLFGDVIDTTLSQGTVGLYAHYNSDAFFDNVLVDSLAVTPTSLVASSDNFARGGGNASTVQGGGTDTTLLVKNDDGSDFDRQSFLKFDVPASLASAWQVLLRLGVAALGDSATKLNLSVQETGDAWSETTLTWNNRPATTGSILDTLAGRTLVAAGVDSTVEFDVTNAAVAAAGGDGVLSLRISTGYNSDGKAIVNFHSRESADASLRPTLVQGAAPTATAALPPVPSATAESHRVSLFSDERVATLEDETPFFA